MDFKTLANLEEVKRMSRGNPSKIADYVVKRSELEGIKAAHFSENHPFVNSFSESHIEELKQFASENPDDESAQVRYALQKERFAVQESSKTAHIDDRVARTDLRNKIAAGEGLTNADLLVAEKLARRISTPENIGMYSKIKTMINEGADEE